MKNKIFLDAISKSARWDVKQEFFLVGLMFTKNISTDEGNMLLTFCNIKVLFEIFIKHIVIEIFQGHSTVYVI